MATKIRYWIALGLVLFGASASFGQGPGETAFEINCLACHQVDRFSVGPSLVEISSTYPKNEVGTFVEWAKNPGKKNPKTIQMPSMAHLGDAVLAEIHAYVLSASAGKKERNRRHDFPDFVSMKPPYPYVKRAFMPDTSPASIAVALDDAVGICWDTTDCRLRYALPSTSGFIGGVKRGAGLRSKMFYREEGDTFWSFGRGLVPEFLGYRMIGPYPEFNYRLGEVEVRELIEKGPEPGSFLRRFTLEGLSQGVTMNLSYIGSGTVISDRGTIENSRLRLSEDEARTFTLTISK